MFTYSDWSKGYQLQLLVRNETEGRELVDRVLNIQNDIPDWKFANLSTNQEEMQAYPTNPGTERVLNEPRKKQRKRPIADVRFQHAVIHLNHLPNPIILFDRSYLHPTALLRSY